MQHAGRIALAVLAVLSGVATAAAQTRTFRVTEPSRRPGCSIGVTQLGESYGHGRGGELDFLFGPMKGLGIVADASFNNFDGFSEAAFMGGLRKTLRPAAAISPFVQLLAGIERCGSCATTDPSVEPAVGVDVAISRSHRVSLRIGGGYRVTPSELRMFKETHLFVGLSVRPDAR